MKIICENAGELKMAENFFGLAEIAGYNSELILHTDAYALTKWSVQNVDCIQDERINSLSSYEKEEFMKFSEKQLREDMIERGWASLDVLLDEYFAEKAEQSKS